MEKSQLPYGVPYR